MSHKPSGRFVIRIDPGLHGALRAAAEAAGMSLNAYCSRRLAAPGMLPASQTIEAVEAAARIGGDRLVGVVVFGSWARGEDGPGSDIDLLIVLDSSTAIRRNLYREWDVQPLTWKGLEIEPHFVSLPAPERRVLGVWAEAAIDGVVLFERNLELSRRLALVRRDIASGNIERRSTSSGQSYWVEAA